MGWDYKAWTLTVGGIFHVHINSSGGKYYTTFNSDALAIQESLRVAQVAAEGKIIRRVRDMLPAYRVIFARFEMEQGLKNVTPLRPKKE